MDSNGVCIMFLTYGSFAQVISSMGLISPSYRLTRTPQGKGSPLLFGTLLYSTGASTYSAPSLDGLQRGPYYVSNLGLINPSDRLTRTPQGKGSPLLFDTLLYLAGASTYSALSLDGLQ